MAIITFKKLPLPTKFLLSSTSIARSITSSSSSPCVAANPDAAEPPSAAAAVPELLLDDTEKLFASIPTGRLVSSLANLYLMAFDPVVDVGMAAMRSPVVEGNAAVRAAVRRTVYRHFCAGEDVEEAGRTLQGMWEQGLRGILDYGLEDAADNAGCDANLAEFLRTVDITSRLPPSSVSFACVKITAICPISLLERVSDLLRWQQKNPSLHLPWKQHSFPVLSHSTPLYHTPSPPPPLTPSEESDLSSAHHRLSALCSRCVHANNNNNNNNTHLPLLVDAEYTSVQPAIDYFTYSAALRFNRGQQQQQQLPVVYGTIQAYLRDSRERLVMAVDAAEREGVQIGFKLVRGAYLSRETKLASSLGEASPVHSSIRETHDCYNDCASIMLHKVARGSGSVVLATHNLESGRVAAAKAEELGIGKGNEKLQFAQLKGMAEGLSLGLRNAGFNVSKYLPFGPVEKVIPYLLRRAEENRGLLSASTLDRQLMRRELKRRLGAAIRGR